jgi:hypothetical protein
MTMHDIALIALGWLAGALTQAWLHRRLRRGGAS